MSHQDELVNNARAIHLRMVMDENKKFRLQLKTVRGLHEPVEYHGQKFCSVCSHDGVPESLAYPCPTIEALDGGKE